MDTLEQHQQLTIGQRLNSNNGRVKLIMQGDGNLVLYRAMFRLPLWASNTWQKPVRRAMMQSDGNFVAYSPNNTAYWATGTWNHPGARVVLQDDGNLVVYSPMGQPLWASNTVQDWSSPTVDYGDRRGYSYVEASESWKELCSGLPCFRALQWPGYATTTIEITLKGQPAVLQLWKGWCQKFLGLQSFPGGVGGEVGVYRRIPGKARPPIPSSLPAPLAAALSTLGSIADDDLWWPAPDLVDSVEFSMINPITNTTFFSSPPQVTYWNCKWMSDGSYAKYQRDQGVKRRWLPCWFPGNSNTPAWDKYVMIGKVNGQSFTWA